MQEERETISSKLTKASIWGTNNQEEARRRVIDNRIISKQTKKLIIIDGKRASHRIWMFERRLRPVTKRMKRKGEDEGVWEDQKVYEKTGAWTRQGEAWGVFDGYHPPGTRLCSRNTCAWCEQSARQMDKERNKGEEARSRERMDTTCLDLNTRH